MIEEYEIKYNVATKPVRRHDMTMFQVKKNIGLLIEKYASGKCDLLEVGGEAGWQTMYYRSMLSNPRRTVIYDWMDMRMDDLKADCDFAKVDLEKEEFPDQNGSYDVVVCNQVFEHLKNIFLPLSEIHRVLRPGGILLLSVPNLSALHNIALLAIGRQPTTIRLFGSHVRSYAIRSMTEFLQYNGLFSLEEVQGFGLHPFTSMSLPGFLKTYCHTPLWVLRKNESTQGNWRTFREEAFTTTNF